MTGEEKTTLDNEFVMPEPDTFSQDATDTTLGTDSVTDAIHEQVMHEREMRARKEKARLREKARQEVEDYINNYLVNTI